VHARSALWHAIVVSLAGHAMVLSQLRESPPENAPHGVAGPPVFRVTFRSPVASPKGKPDAALRSEAAPMVAAARQPRVETPPQPVAAASKEPRGEPAPAPAPAASMAEKQEPAADQPYLPRGQLTVAPKPLGMVQVPFPEEVTGVVDLKVQATVFIDETGTVQRIRVDTPDLNPAFERAIRETFGVARFSPGEIQQVPVRSQIRVEVEFHAPSRPPSAIAGSRRSRS
jgi:hypothetical protein